MRGEIWCKISEFAGNKQTEQPPKKGEKGVMKKFCSLWAVIVISALTSALTLVLGFLGARACNEIIPVIRYFYYHYL